MRRVNGQIVMCCIMLAIFGGMVFDAAAFPPGARLLPFVIGIPAIALTLLQLGIEWRRADGTGVRAEPRPDAASLRRERALILWFLGLIGTVLLIGFPVGGPLFIAAFTRFYAREPWRIVIVATAIAAIVISVVFEEFLGIILFEGFLLQYLTG